jgi:hypothetical protein
MIRYPNRFMPAENYRRISGASSDAAGTVNIRHDAGHRRDASGSVVPSAKIVITNQGENVSRTVLTDSQGNFEALNLKAGVYSVSAEANGFKTYKDTGLELPARQTMRVNVSLQVGSVTEALEVEASAPVVATDTSTIASTFHPEQVLGLPANYRGAGSTSPYTLLAYQPGIQSDNGNSFSLQGGLPAQTEVSLDGISTVGVASNGPLTQLFPSVDGIAEMKVQGVGNNAEFAQVGDITTTSRGGSNQFQRQRFRIHAEPRVRRDRVWRHSQAAKSRQRLRRKSGRLRRSADPGRTLNGEYTTHRFIWQADQLTFQGLHGHRDDDANEFERWAYQPNQGRLIPQQPTPVRMSLWLFNGRAPSDNMEVEIIISQFAFIPLDQLDSALRHVRALETRGQEQSD